MQVALKRQQAAEDAIALGIRAMATGESYNYLPPGPILGLPLAMQAQEHSNAERRIRGKISICHSVPYIFPLKKSSPNALKLQKPPHSCSSSSSS